MQRTQKKYGRDRFEVVLVSIDIGYGQEMQKVERDVKGMMGRYKVDWPSVIDPLGWNGVMRRFNIGGYGLLFVGPDGIVRAVDARGEDLDKLLERFAPGVGKTAGTH